MDKILLTQNSRLYVLCPSYFKTGGTELLHQYVFMARKNGINCCIVYPKVSDGKTINPAFEKYVDTFLLADDIIDSKDNVLIIPEVYTSYLKHFKNIRKIVWWESVDNYLKQSSILFNFKNISENWLSSIKRILCIIFRRSKFSNISTLIKKADYHFAQSYYAIDFLEKNGITGNVYFVSDYINDCYLSNELKIDLSKKENIVCYNPAKGKKFTNKIIKAAKNIQFVPLVNMSNDEVVAQLKKSKVYIDFGSHPGKDRFPREAASMYCCVITNKKGAAAFYDDVKIDSNYKFEQKNKNIKKIIGVIDKCIVDYDNEILKFEEYRRMISLEKAAFERSVIDCYKKH